MKRKILSLLTLLCIAVTGAWADEAVLYYNDNNAHTLTVNGFTMDIHPTDATKKWSAGNGNITYNETAYKTLKNSNGGKITVDCPSGKVATNIVFYVTTNADTSGVLSEIDGTTCSETVTSCKDYSSPTVIEKSIDSKSSFTFTFSTKQVCFIAVVTYADAPSDVVANPAINLEGSSLTISCATAGAKIFYTTDGSEPTTSSTQYSSAVTLGKSCTVRAKAFNGESNEYSSEIVKKDCYVAASTALAVLKFADGAVNGTDAKIWESNDGDYTLTTSSYNQTDLYATLNTANDAFKLTHMDTYTLTVPEDVKVTKIVFVGKTWQEGYQAYFDVTDFTTSDAYFINYPSEGVNYLKAVEFESSSMSYGSPVVFNPRGCQSAAYIEIYGEERTGPASPEAVEGEAITWDFTGYSSDESLTANATTSYTADDGSTEMRYTAGSSDKISKDGYLRENGGTGGSNDAKDIDDETVIGKTRLIRLFVTGKGKLTINCTSNIGVYDVYNSNATNTAYDGGTALLSGYTANTTSEEISVTNGLWIETTTKGYITSIVWTASSDDITLTTTANMDGWRAFYDASNNYSVDGNTKVFVAPTDPVENVLTLTSIAGVPAGVPVILKTTADDRTMTLTKAAADTYTYGSGNKLEVADGSETISDKYRLGYGADGVGFYPYSGTPAAGTVYLNVSSAAARALSIAFDDVTGIQAIGKEQLTTDNVYDLSGRRIVNGKSVNGKLQRGLYIVNGKKVVVK